MTLDVCIIAATAHFSGLKNWLHVLRVHVYGTLYAIVHVHVRVIFSLALRCHNVLIIVHHKSFCFIYIQACSAIFLSPYWVVAVYMERGIEHGHSTKFVTCSSDRAATYIQSTYHHKSL